MTFYSSRVLILLLVNYAVQPEGNDNVLPGLTMAGEDEAEGGGGQTSWTLKNEGLDNFPGSPVLQTWEETTKNRSQQQKQRLMMVKNQRRGGCRWEMPNW